MLKIIEVENCATCPYGFLEEEDQYSGRHYRAHRCKLLGIGKISNWNEIHPNCPLKDKS